MMIRWFPADFSSYFLGLGFIRNAPLTPLGTGAQQLRLSPEGASFRSDLPGGDFSGSAVDFIPLDELKGCYFDDSAYIFVKQIEAGKKAPPPTRTRATGIYFSQKHGRDREFQVKGIVRSEERRVGKECRCRWWAEDEKKK